MIHELTYRLDEGDLIRAFRLLGRRRNARRVVPIFLAGIVGSVLALVLLIGSWERLFASPAMIALSAIAIFLASVLMGVYAALPSLRRRAARDTLAHNANFEEPVTISFDEREFRHRAVYAASQYPWEKLHGWREDEALVIVQPSTQLFYAIPRCLLDPEAEGVLLAGLARTDKGRLDV